MADARVTRVLVTFLSLTLLSTGLLTACAAQKGPEPAGAGPKDKPSNYVLRIGSPMDETYAGIQVASLWADLVQSRTKGAVRFEKYWGGTILKRPETLRTIGSGLVDIGVDGTRLYPNELKLNTIPTLFGPSDMQMAADINQALAEKEPAILGEYAMFNIMPLFSIPQRGADLLSVKPIVSAKDFKGKKIAYTGVYETKLIEPVGAIAASVNSPERYLAMQTGLIEGTVMLPDVMETYKWYEVAKYYTHLELGAAPGFPVMINRDTWAKLPADIQQIMREAGKEAAKKGISMVLDQTEKAIAHMKQEGVTFQYMTKEARAEWINALPELALMWIEDARKLGRPGQPVMEAYFKLCEERGYKFPRQWKTSK